MITGERVVTATNAVAITAMTAPSMGMLSLVWLAVGAMLIGFGS